MFEVAIFDGDSPPALAFVRSLGRLGVSVRVYDPHLLPVSRVSRYAGRFTRCPSLDDVDRFLPWLAAQVGSGRIHAIAPTSDRMAWYISEVRHLFSPEVQAATPTREASLRVLLKDRFVAPAGSPIQTPRTLVPSSEEEAQDLAAQLRYPVMVKPRSHLATPNERGFVVETAEEARRRFVRYDVPRGLRPLLDRFEHIDLPVLQEYVNVAPERLRTVSGVLDEQGRAAALLCAKKHQQWPPRVGIGLVFDTCTEPALEEAAERFVQQMLGRGLFELEVVEDPRDGKLLALDLNPRGFGQMRFDVARGADLPALWYHLLRGERVSPVRAGDSDVRFVHSLPLSVRTAVGLTLGPHRQRTADEFREAFHGSIVDVIHDGQDLLPSVVFLGKMLRHPGGLLRPFIRAYRDERRPPAQPAPAPDVPETPDE